MPPLSAALKSRKKQKVEMRGQVEETKNSRNSLMPVSAPDLRAPGWNNRSVSRAKVYLTPQLQSGPWHTIVCHTGQAMLRLATKHRDSEENRMPLGVVNCLAADKYICGCLREILGFEIDEENILEPTRSRSAYHAAK